MNKDITVILLAHKSENLVMKFIKNIYNKFQIIIIDNSNDLNLEKKIEKFQPKKKTKRVKKS